MKKIYLLMAAASAIMLTACTSEDDVVLADKAQQTVADEAVGFDVYVPAATQTRAGLEGTMTTSRLQRSEYQGGGFGVYAFLVEDAIAGADATDYISWNRTVTTKKYPNFMLNEKLLWNDADQGWYYNPLKYWPNETNKDSQASPAEMDAIGTSNQHLDRLSFFAYAPYVKQGKVGVPGIEYLTDELARLNDHAPSASGENFYTDGTVGKCEPSIGYRASLDDPNKAVDLVWGVAPAGGLTYTAVNGQTVTVKEGEPLIDMTKPNVNTNMKFLFQHALARIGITAVAAIDQVGAGGKLDENTKITIDEITLTGYFGETGILNLDNDRANIANWVDVNGIALNYSTTKDALQKTKLTLRANTTSAEPLAIAEHLRFVGPHATPVKQESSKGKNDRVGVTTIRQSVIEPAAIDNTLGKNRNWYTSKTYAANELAYSETTPYYTDEDCSTKATATATASVNRFYTVDSKGVYTPSAKTINLQYPAVNNYYDGNFTLITAANKDTYKKYQAYTFDGTKQVYVPKPVGQEPELNDYVITKMDKAQPYYAGSKTYYKRDANYFMVVPTNNFKHCQPGFSDADEIDFRTVRVKIKYYITTEDANLQAKRAQTENVIEKDVVFPSLANGKSYNLNLVLGLTSVKMEAEVDDWKVVNVQADLPQNTAE